VAGRKRLLRLMVAVAVLTLVGVALRRLLRSSDQPPIGTEPVIVPGQGTSGEAVRIEADASKESAPKRQTKPKKELTGTTGTTATELEVSAAPWVEPIDGACPTSHPVKAKAKSKIFHIVGGGSYERTNADRCYLDPAAATDDGFRQSKV
jgi:hypothetical protein